MTVKTITKPEVLVQASNGITAEEAFTRAGRRILSNSELDKMLMSGEWEKVKEALPCWTGTMAGYEKPGKALGKTVEREDAGLTWIFPVPTKFQGEKDVCLSVDHPHFTVKVDGKKRTIIVDDEANVRLTKDFPAEDGWHKTDENGIPCSDKLNEDHPHARYLYRADQMVGPVARSFNGHYDGRDVYLDGWPSRRLGVVVEGKPAGEAGTPEKSAELKMEEKPGELTITGPEKELARAKRFFEFYMQQNRE